MKVDFATRAGAAATEVTIVEISPLVHNLAKVMAAARCSHRLISSAKEDKALTPF